VASPIGVACVDQAVALFQVVKGANDGVHEEVACARADHFGDGRAPWLRPVDQQLHLAGRPRPADRKRSPVASGMRTALWCPAAPSSRCGRAGRASIGTGRRLRRASRLIRAARPSWIAASVAGSDAAPLAVVGVERQAVVLDHFRGRLGSQRVEGELVQLFPERGDRLLDPRGDRVGLRCRQGSSLLAAPPRTADQERRAGSRIIEPHTVQPACVPLRPVRRTVAAVPFHRSRSFSPDQRWTTRWPHRGR
jgi:hypothetical protein